MEIIGDYYRYGNGYIHIYKLFCWPSFFWVYLEVPSDSPSVMAVWEDPWHRKERARGRVLRRATKALAVAGGVAMVSCNGEAARGALVAKNRGFFCDAHNPSPSCQMKYGLWWC